MHVVPHPLINSKSYKLFNDNIISRSNVSLNNISIKHIWTDVHLNLGQYDHKNIMHVFFAIAHQKRRHQQIYAKYQLHSMPQTPISISAEHSFTCFQKFVPSDLRTCHADGRTGCTWVANTAKKKKRLGSSVNLKPYSTYHIPYTDSIHKSLVDSVGSQRLRPPHQQMLLESWRRYNTLWLFLWPWLAYVRAMVRNIWSWLSEWTWYPLEVELV